MRITPLLVVAFVGLVASEGFSREIPKPPALELPTGSDVRLRTQASSEWIKGILASADAGTIALVPEQAPPLGANQLRLPSEGVTELEVLTGRRSRWLPGLLVGAAAGVAMGLDTDVDPVQCEFDDNYFCSRTSAVVAITATSAFLGALVGKLIKSDVWTPVALDALGPPPETSAWAGLRLRPVPGGVGVALSVQFGGADP